MKQLKRFFSALSLFILVITVTSAAYAASGDTTWVRTFDEDFINWATAHVDTFALPDTSIYYSSIAIFYTIGCPDSPADCDPWDRLGWLQVMHDTGEVDTLGQPVLEGYEIARIITPYDITGGSRPGECTWQIDVTDYKTFLHDTVILKNYIESWIGDDRGWLVTIDFAFVEGWSELDPYKVVNLWTNNRIVFGDPDRPIEDILHPMRVPVDAGAEAVKIRVVTTGHGQGNTDNCAEFCPKEHTLIVNGYSNSYYPWRDDCNVNPCSPQGGTWQYSRAGWCPGDDVLPWDWDVTEHIVPGDSVKLNYDVEPYENLCRPNNPDCVDGVTCADCDYNYTGHTEPHYTIQSQLIFYREGPPAGVGEEGDVTVPRAFTLYQNYPNPFNPSTTISFDIGENLDEGQQASLNIYDIRGRLVRRLIDFGLCSGSHKVNWDGRDERGEPVSSGIYIYSLKAGGTNFTRKMILMK
jgi:hypothetical protein